jgi:hypothetical protein
MSYDDKLPDVVSPRDVAFKMKTDYSRGIKDHTEKVLESMTDLCRKAEQPNADVRAILKEAAELVSKRFGIAAVSIAVRNPVDKLFRYEAVVGVGEEAVAEFNRLVYTEEQVTDENTYKSHTISDFTKLYLDEDHPYAPGEESSYNRPGLLDMKRRSITDSLEADYLDVYFRGKYGDLLGWIEMSGTRLRKLPDTMTIKWVELLACYLSVAIRLHRSEGSA